MKRIFLISAVIIIFAGMSYSQTGWTEQTSGTTQTLTSVNAYFSYVWACGYAGTVLRSSNIGDSWLNVSGNGIPTNIQLTNVAAIGQNSALVAGYIGANTFVYRTTNSGANWIQVFTETNGFIDAIYMKPSQNNGFMMGDPVGGRWSLWKTTNGGANWDSTGLYLPQIGSEAGWNNSLFGIDDRLWFGTNNTKIYYSTNFGSNWTAQVTSGEINSYALWFENLTAQQNGLLGGAILLSTTNFGANWNSLSSLGTGNFGGILGGPYIITDNNLIVPYKCYVRSDNKIYAATGSGTNWFVQYTAPSGNYRYVGSDYYVTGCWAVRDNGGISHLELISSVKNISAEVPDKFSLSQNYPNPFNPSTNIEYRLLKPGLVRLKVFNSMGQEIKTLVNEHQSAGTYRVTFDPDKNLSSGIYFYRIETENFSDSKQMILLK